MNEKEKAKLKKEIKAEVIQEVLLELSKPNKNNELKKGEDFDFDEYKIKVTRDDILKTEKFISSYKWYWFLPLVGWIFYLYEYVKAMSSIDRGTLREKLIIAGAIKLKNPLILFYYILAYGAGLLIIINLLPITQFKAMALACELAKKEIELSQDPDS